jgi:hypothetical protein
VQAASATRLMSRVVWAGRVAAGVGILVACVRRSLSSVERVCKVKVAVDGYVAVGCSDGEGDGRERRGRTKGRDTWR